MSLDPVYRCDGPTDATFEEHDHCVVHSGSAADFITVRDFDGRELHFCTWDCLMRRAAMVEPCEVFDA